MKFSLKTKFYVYILPLLVILPILIYSLVSPYTQLNQAFTRFEIDSQQALLIHEFSGALDTQQLELFHRILDLHLEGESLTMDNNEEYNMAVISVEEYFDQIKLGISEDLYLDEEREIIEKLDGLLEEFQNLANQVIVLSDQGKQEEALSFIGTDLDEYLDLNILPAVETLSALKEDDVKTNLPYLTQTLTRTGVLSALNVQEDIEYALDHFQNSIEAQKTARLFDDLQSELFDWVIEEDDLNEVGFESEKAYLKVLEIEKEIPAILVGMKGRLSENNEEDVDELSLIMQIEENYSNLLVLNDRIIELNTHGNNQEALGVLTGEVFAYIENTIDPLVESLTIGDQQDVKATLEVLSKKIDAITYVIYGFCVVFVLLGLASLWKLSRDIINPIITLRNAASKLARGDFSTRVMINTKDEIGELANTFNIMAEKLEEFYGQLAEKVKTQTIELSQRVSELESAKKATINLLEDLQVEKNIAMEAQAQAEAILQGIGDAVFAIDPSGKIILFNAIASQISGFSQKEALGKQYTDVLKFSLEDTMQPNNSFIKIALSGKKSSMVNHTVVTDKDGQIIPVADSAAPIIDDENKVVGVVVVFRDVTKEREVDIAKTEFVSLASHQLRTPLTAIGWFAEMLLSGDAGALKPKQKEHVVEIHAANKRMVDLVNSLLNVSRIDLGTFAVEPQEISLSDIADSVLGEMQPQIKTRGTIITKKYDVKVPKFNADPQLTRIVIQNLLTNAVKYTQEKGRVTISIVKKGNMVEIQVADNGYGVPKDARDKIFTKLFRADNAKEKEPDGNGLGLYIVKAIVEQSGGKIWFESEENKGSTFYVSLPLSGVSKKQGSKALA